MNLPAAKDLGDQSSAVSLVLDVAAPAHHSCGRVDERDRSGSGGEFDKTLALAGLGDELGASTIAASQSLRWSSDESAQFDTVFTDKS